MGDANEQPSLQNARFLFASAASRMSHRRGRIHGCPPACCIGVQDFRMWALINRTPFSAERTWTRDKHGNHLWIVAVRATYEFSPSSGLKLSDEQPCPVRLPEYSSPDQP